MKPTVLQDKTLTLYRQFHVTPPTVGSLWRKSIGAHLRIVLLSGITATASWFLLDLPYFSFFMVGLAAGSLLRDYGRIKQTVQLWPMLETIINWRGVDEWLEATRTQDNAA